MNKIAKYWFPGLLVFGMAYILIAPSNESQLSWGQHLMLVFRALLLGGALFGFFAIIFGMIDRK